MSLKVLPWNYIVFWAKFDVGFVCVCPGEEPPESLFMKELKRRGMTPTSLLEDTNRGSNGVEDEIKLGEEDRGFSKRNAVSTEFDQSLSNQRKRSMSLSSEGLEVNCVFLFLIHLPNYYLNISFRVLQKKKKKREWWVFIF